MRIGSVPAGAVLLLCVCCFLAGRFLQQNAELPDPDTGVRNPLYTFLFFYDEGSKGVLWTHTPILE